MAIVSEPQPYDVGNESDITNANTFRNSGQISQPRPPMVMPNPPTFGAPSHLQNPNLFSQQNNINIPPPPQNPETDVTRIWAVLTELLEQLSINRNASIQLHSLAAGVKTQAVHSQTGFVLRRFNLDKTQEEYNAALEQMNTQMAAENHNLANENKQLSALIKEYEQTLENVMGQFRVRANEVQQRELAIMREYERRILLRDTEELARSLDQSTAFSTSLGRMGELLRTLTRVLGGEDPAVVPASILAAPTEIETGTSSVDITTTAGHMTIGRHPQKRIINSLELEPPPSPVEPTSTFSTSSASTESSVNSNESQDNLVDREAQLAAADWALERECELARLERENEILRHLVEEQAKLARVGQDEELAAQDRATAQAMSQLPKLNSLPKRANKGMLGGRGIGPFGMYKKFEEQRPQSVKLAEIMSNEDDEMHMAPGEQNAGRLALTRSRILGQSVG